MDRNIKYEIVCTENCLDVGLMIGSCNGIPTCILARPYEGEEREYGIGHYSLWYRTGKFMTRSEWNKTAGALTTAQIVSYYRLKNKVKFEEKPKTNADRIRSMTDEELAELLGTRFDVASVCENLEDGCWYKCKTHECDYDETKLIIKWLKSEVGCE